MSLLDDAADWLRGAVPGSVVSSAHRSVADNIRVGGQPNSYHLRDQAIDLVPPSGMTMSGLYNTLNGAFTSSGIKPIEFINEGDHVHMAFSQNQVFGADGAAPAGGNDWWSSTRDVLLGALPGFNVAKEFLPGEAKTALGIENADWLVRGAFIAVALILLAAGIFMLVQKPAMAIVKEVL